MARSIKEIPKKRGRPATGKDPLITMRLPEEMIAQLDARAAAANVSRSEIVRRMIEAGLRKRSGSKS